MKLNSISRVLILSFSLSAGYAIANDGNVHFTGEVIDSTCEVTTETANQTVKLGKVNKTAFTGVGSTAAPANFHIDLDKCPATYTKAAVRFDADDTNGTFKGNADGDVTVGFPVESTAPGDFTGTGTAAAATGVAIRLYNSSDNSHLKIGDDSTPVTISSGKASMPFIARYIATSATVTPGTANADTQFTVIYTK